MLHPTIKRRCLRAFLNLETEFHLMLIRDKFIVKPYSYGVMLQVKS